MTDGRACAGVASSAAWSGPRPVAGVWSGSRGVTRAFAAGGTATEATALCRHEPWLDSFGDDARKLCLSLDFTTVTVRPITHPVTGAGSRGSQVTLLSGTLVPGLPRIFQAPFPPCPCDRRPEAVRPRARAFTSKRQPDRDGPRHGKRRMAEAPLSAPAAGLTPDDKIPLNCASPP